jgi:hypothetical protein
MIKVLVSLLVAALAGAGLLYRLYYFGRRDYFEEKLGVSAPGESELNSFLYRLGRRRAEQQWDEFEKLNQKISDGEALVRMMKAGSATLDDATDIARNECDVESLQNTLDTWKDRRDTFARKFHAPVPPEIRTV